MTNSYDLTNLDTSSFEQLVNMLTITVLGSGHTGFGPGADAGRDGFFEGVALYPSEEEKWSGVWYIQSKFHKPHLSKDPQKWLIQQIKIEIAEFNKGNGRKWPDNWIIATNIDPSGKSETGAFDMARKLVKKANPKLAERFHIWGGRKIIDLLVINSNVADYYSHFLMPGHVLKELYESLNDEKASIKDIIRFLVIKEFDAHQFTKLDQAGSESDARPGVHKLYVDLPFESEVHQLRSLVAQELLKTSAKNHKYTLPHEGKDWYKWGTYPSRSRIWFIQGGPGQGKSTTGQYCSQLMRASLILDWDGDPIHSKYKEAATEIKDISLKRDHWSSISRIPINIELKDYAQWFSKQANGSARGVLSYLSHRIHSYVEKKVSPMTIKRALSNQRWFVVFDGLDEVPSDVKDSLATSVKEFINDTIIECNSDTHFVCTSRPQGYSGQFDELECSIIKLRELSPTKALECAEPVIKIGRNDIESAKGIAILRSAILSPAVRALMTTPLQSHIMAVVVRDGKKPPERRWQLFENFYQVIKRREANRDLPEERIARLLREEEQLLRTVHNRLGFVLHAKAETSDGAQTNLSRQDFKSLALRAVSEMKSASTDDTVDALMEATATRLVLVNTPDDGDHLRFDIRQLQEFFAAEFIHDAVTLEEFRERISVLTGDSHWREVVHFLLSAMVESRRLTEIVELVQVLEEVNEGGDDTNKRSLHRRLCRGALLAARLLQDGVLEQDKRIRNKFRNVIEPLTASIFLSDLEPIYQLGYPDSCNWLIDFCIERLREADYAESVGAAILLTRLLRDDDNRCREYLDIINSKPASYKSEVLGSWNDPADESRIMAPKWVCQVALQSLVSESWYLLGSHGIDGSLSIITTYARTEQEFIEQEIEQINAPKFYKNLLIMLGQNVRKIHSSSNTQEAEFEEGEDFGIISDYYTKYDWKGGLFIDENLSATLIPSEFNDKFGLLSLADSVWRFSRENTYNNLKNIIDLIIDNKLILNSIPNSLFDYIPFVCNQSNFNKISKITSSEFDSWISSAPRSCRFKPIKSDYVPTSNQWNRLSTKHPRVSVLLTIEGILQEDTKLIQCNKYLNVVASVIKINPSLLNNCSILTWGKLLKSNFSEEEIRSFFIVAAKNKDITYSRGYHGVEFFPFLIKIPEENVLLPLLLTSVVRYTDSKLRFHTSVNISRSDQVDETGAIIKEFFPNVSIIPNVDVHAINPTCEDGYFLMLHLLHPDLAINFEDYFEYIPRLFEITLDKIFLEILLFYVSIRYSESSEGVGILISKLLELSREDFELRKLFEDLLLNWREVSHSPVSKIRALELWL
ncbi:MAG: hypothetical protein V4727_10210 [Verrucomicrobiota bacterium]